MLELQNVFVRQDSTGAKDCKRCLKEICREITSCVIHQRSLKSLKLVLHPYVGCVQWDGV